MAVVVVGAVGALGGEVYRENPEAAVYRHYVWEHSLIGGYAEIWAVEDAAVVKAIFTDIQLEHTSRIVAGKKHYPIAV